MAAPRITVVTAGHLATCPRLVKAADALAGEGYRVRVVSGRFLDWATAADEEIATGGRWSWEAVDYRRSGPRSAWWRALSTSLRLRAARRLADALTPSRTPLRWAVRAGSRIFDELARAACREPADLIYGGTTGGLAPAAAAAGRRGIPYAFDLEDFHCGERPEGEGALDNAINGRVERALLPGAAFLTAGSAAIAGAYGERYGVEAVAIHNTFPLPAGPPPGLGAPAGEPSGEPRPLSLYWFSQTVGPGRGLEPAVLAMGLAGLAGELHLRGKPIPGYVEELGRLAAARAPRLTVVWHPPLPPGAMVEACHGHDLGLGLETGFSLGNRLALPNKVLTYILAGLAVAVTDTPGQRRFARDLGEGALVVPPGDSAALAEGLVRFAADPALLARARRAAWEAAGRRWHWEHPLERGALLAAVSRVFAR
jgi:hypothetical protein